METHGGLTSRRSLFAVAVIGTAWAALVFLFFMTLSSWPSSMPDDERPFHVSSLAWALGTLAVVALIGALVAVVVKESARWQDDGSRENGVQVAGLMLTLAAWFFGGVVTLGLYMFNVPFNLFANVPGDICGGSGGAGTFACLHRVGRTLHVLGVVSALLASPVTWASFWMMRRSRLAAGLAPVIVFALYLLALRLWLPHEGLGVPDRPDLQP
ncbi:MULTISPECIES: hypothetical protein [Actinomadura]|uniref:DUF998 domain-containing protein n=1 Tax=Actinomadura yumaensis TaxID=111807 RepID=A0ABW2CPN0_9ACTN|nr:hypothetical protein [Actinomadura sp. J1-007]MWK36589.1 hypothetical protein [Actinomadura sp. J1-007]